MDINKIRKQYDSNAGIILPPEEEKLWLPSKALPLNYVLGGGIPYGTIVEEFGWESTGKSLLAADFGAVAQALGGVVLWNDAEFAFGDSANFYRGLKLNPSEVEILADDAIERFSDWAMDMCTYYRSKFVNNEPILLVCDSIAALECEEAQGGKQSGSKKEMGNRAKAIYKFYRTRRKLLKQLGICTIMINQVRDKVGANMFQDSTTTPGGAATAFYASVRLALMRGRNIKDGDMKVGNYVHCFIKKNKVSTPRDKVLTEVHFKPDLCGYIGYHRYSGLGAILTLNGFIKKKGKEYTLEGGIPLGTSKTTLDDAFVTNKKARLAAIELLDINTVSKTRAKLLNIDKNLYKVPAKKKKKED